MENQNLVPLYITIVSGLFAGAGFLFKYFFGEKKVKEEPVKDRRKMIKLEYHPVFAELSELESFFLSRYRHNDEGRQTLAVEMIVHTVRNWRIILEKFAKEMDECTDKCDLSKVDCNKVFNIAMEGYTKGLEYSSIWHQQDSVHSVHGDMVYTPADKATMLIYSDAFSTFNSLNEAMLEMIIKDVSNSQLYDNCGQKACIILHGYYLMFNLLRMSADNALKTLNGSLTGKEFLGVTIGE